MGWATCDSISAGDAPGQARVDADDRQVHRRKAVHAQIQVTGDADDDERQDDHRREDRSADADFGELLH